MDSLISINQAAGPLGALIEWLCVVAERLAGGLDVGKGLIMGFSKSLEMNP